MASASIRSQEQEHSRTSSQEGRLTNLVLDGDLEAQHESDVRVNQSSFVLSPRPMLKQLFLIRNLLHSFLDLVLKRRA